MENIAVVDIIKKFVIFICLSISLVILLIIFSILFGPYSPLIMSIDDYFVMIIVLMLVAVIAKYIGEIAIVVLKSKRE